MKRKAFCIMTLLIVFILPAFSQTTGKRQLLYYVFDGREITSDYSTSVDYGREGTIEEIHVRTKFSEYSFDFFHFQPERNNYDFYGVLRTASPEISINGTATKNSSISYTEWNLSFYYGGSTA